jgi:hypothetical protein
MMVVFALVLVFGLGLVALVSCCPDDRLYSIRDNMQESGRCPHGEAYTDCNMCPFCNTCGANSDNWMDKSDCVRCTNCCDCKDCLRCKDCTFCFNCVGCCNCKGLTGRVGWTNNQAPPGAENEPIREAKKDYWDVQCHCVDVSFDSGESPFDMF